MQLWITDWNSIYHPHGEVIHQADWAYNGEEGIFVFDEDSKGVSRDATIEEFVKLNGQFPLVVTEQLRQDFQGWLNIQGLYGGNYSATIRLNDVEFRCGNYPQG